jgi:hypothetical protein
MKGLKLVSQYGEVVALQETVQPLPVMFVAFSFTHSPDVVTSQQPLFI